MKQETIENNRIKLMGEVVTEPVLHHETYGEKFYMVNVKTARLSEADDIAPVVISEKIINFKKGNFVNITGQVRTYNEYDKAKRKLIVYIFVLDVELSDEETCKINSKLSNQVTLKGFLCKAPSYRITPFGREITDMLVAVNRSYHKSDYIPTIAWGRNAKYANKFEVGQRVELTGRFQSRNYNKKLESGEIITLVAYEISVLNIVAVQE